MMTTKLRRKVISLSMVHCCWLPPSRCRWQCHHHPSARSSDPIGACTNEAFPILQLSQPQDDDIMRCAVSAFGVQCSPFNFRAFQAPANVRRGQENCSQHIVLSQSKCRRPDAHAFKLLSVQSNGVRLCGIVQWNFLPFERQKRHYCLKLHIVLRIRINMSRKSKRKKRTVCFLDCFIITMCSNFCCSFAVSLLRLSRCSKLIRFRVCSSLFLLLLERN